MPEGTINYRIFAALETNAAFDMFKSAGLFDDPTDLEELALNDQDHLAEELNFELNF